MSGGSNINNLNSVIIVSSVQAVYSAVLPPSLMCDGIFSEKMVLFFLKSCLFLVKEEY